MCGPLYTPVNTTVFAVHGLKINYLWDQIGIVLLNKHFKNICAKMERNAAETL